jgi:mono/diheme cytochrome c family protein
VRPVSGFLFLTGLVLSVATAGAADRFNLPQGPGRDLIYGHCQTCHDLQSVEDSAGIRRGAWDAVLDNMREFGLRISDDQRARILDYLATYLGPNPPAEAPVPTPEMAAVDGAQVFDDTCIACHQADGMGKPGEFPPLTGNHDLFLTPDFLATVVLNGIEGPIDVNGQPFDNAMPPFDFLSDEEIAAVVNYVGSNWGNDAIRPAGVIDVAPADVAALRAKPLEPAAVHDLRASLK